MQLELIKLRKIPLVSVIALLLLAGLVSAALILPRKGAEFNLPKTVTLYRESHSDIITLSFDELIRGSVFAVTSPKKQAEALEATACAAATRAIYLMKHKSGFRYNGADLSDTDFPYLSVEEIEEEYGAQTRRYIEKVDKAVKSGISNIITYNGEPIYAAVCEISAGKTDNAEDIIGKPLSCLVSVKTEFDKEAEGYESSASLSPNMVYTALRDEYPQAFLPARAETWFKNPQYTENGTLICIEYGGVRVTGAKLKELLNLRSAAITLEYAEDCFMFSCRGCGENLGMSLYGAEQLALQGWQAEDIISYFYPESELVSCA